MGGDWGRFRGLLPRKQKLFAWVLWEPWLLQ